MFIVLAPLFLQAQNMSQNGFRSLFSDYKAVNIGDAITIIVVESSEASNNASKSTNRDSDIGFDFGSLTYLSVSTNYTGGH